MKFSLIIPSKNRLNTLRHCLESCLVCDYPDLEIIVSNNHSEDGTEEYLATITDERVKIIKPPSAVSMRANFEFALDNSSGDYLIYIGDDDGLTSYGLQVLAHLIETTNADVISWFPIAYVWPDTIAPKTEPSLVFRSRQFSSDYEVIDPKAVLDSFVDGTVHNYMDGAKVYHGCVSRALIDEVRQNANGQYFGAMSPDVYAAIANLRFAKKFIRTNCAITISGKSANSNGWANVKATGNRKHANKFFTDSEASKIPDPRSLVDLKIRSLRVHELDALLLVNNDLFDNKLEIDYQAWVNNIGSSLNCGNLEEHNDCIEKIEDLTKQFNVSVPITPEFKPPEPSRKKRKPIINRLKHTRCYSRSLDTVAAAAAHLNYPASSSISNGKFMHFLRWLRFQNSFTRKIRSEQSSIR